MKRLSILIAVLAVFVAVSCSPERVVDTGVKNVENPMQGKSVYYKGETVNIRFDAQTAWSAELEFKQGA